MNHMQRSLSPRLVAKTVQRSGKIKLRLDVWGFNPEQETDTEVRVSLTTNEVEGVIRHLSALLDHMKENERG